MTNTTQCPACQTRFKVSEAQLAAANGLVRCGRCAHVFNATDHFAKPAPPAAPIDSPPAVTPPAPTPAVDIDDFELEVPDFDPSADTLPDATRPGFTDEFEQADHGNGPSSEDVEAFQQALSQALHGQSPSATLNSRYDAPVESEPPSSERAVETTLETEEIPAIFETRRTTTAQSEARIEPEAENLPSTPLEALPQAAQPNTTQYDPAGGESTPKRKRPLVSALILLASLLALLLLAGQLIYINRTLIASQAPEMRPLLENACQRLGCNVPLATDQEFIRTEWSELSFVPEHTNLVQLAATLKNHAPYPQAYPVLEVTLKDASNQILIRKVFTPGEYLKPASQKVHGFEANSEVKITMRLDVGNVHAQGYSLYWFYP